jgi:hypothetical protein
MNASGDFPQIEMHSLNLARFNAKTLSITGGNNPNPDISTLCEQTTITNLT